MKKSVWRKSLISLATVGIAFATSNSQPAAANDGTTPEGRRIGYIFSRIYFAITETEDGKAECPNGLNTMGPREQFKALYVDDGKKRSFEETQLKREAEIWWPDTSPEPFPVPAAEGKIVPGLNLDGKVKPTDFTSPEGVTGVDNQMFRAIGCIKNYRTGATLLGYERDYFKNNLIGRVMLELTDVDSLINDDDVTLTTYRGLDPLVTDATGNKFQPGGTERIDLKYGKAYINSAKGKIVNGVLTTQPMNWTWPNEMSSQDLMRDARFELKLTPEKADGLVGGYADIEHNYASRNRKWPSHYLAYGQQAMASTYRSWKRFADAYPDPETGEFTAISAAYTVNLTQVRIMHPDKKVSEVGQSVSKQVAGNDRSKAATK